MGKSLPMSVWGMTLNWILWLGFGPGALKSVESSLIAITRGTILTQSGSTC